MKYLYKLVEFKAVFDNLLVNGLYHLLFEMLKIFFEDSITICLGHENDRNNIENIFDLL